MTYTTEDVLLINTILKSVGEHASSQVKSAKTHLSTDGANLLGGFLEALSGDAIKPTRDLLNEAIGKENDTHGEEETAGEGEGRKELP